MAKRRRGKEQPSCIIFRDEFSQLHYAAPSKPTHVSSIPGYLLISYHTSYHSYIPLTLSPFFALLLLLLVTTTPSFAISSIDPTPFTPLPNTSLSITPNTYLSVTPNTSLSITTPSTSMLQSNCKWDYNNRWPSDVQGPTLVIGFLMTRQGFKIKERLGLKIPGMISYAVKNINDERMLPQNYSLQIEIRDTKGDEIESTKYVTDMVCKNISAFIGPESTCWVEASIAEAVNRPMISYACTDSRAFKRNTFARTNPSESHILRATLATLRHFNWDRFSIIFDANGGFDTMATTLDEMAKAQNMTVNHLQPFEREAQFPKIFKNTKNKTRIYVLIAHRQAVPRALLAMSLSGLLNPTKKDYFLLYVDKEEFKQENWIKFIFEPMTIDQLRKTNDCRPIELQAFQDGFMVITNTLPNDNDNVEEKAREFNKKQPFCFASDVTKSLSRHVPFLHASYLYDAVRLYADVITELYNEDVAASNQTVEVVNFEEIARDGRRVADRLTNRTFTSVLGFNVTMGSDRASQGSYSVYYFKNSVECAKANYHSRLNCTTHCLVNISDFRNNKLSTDIKIDILDVPKCGYDGENCPQTSEQSRLYGSFTQLAVISVLLIFSIYKYRHWKYEQEISGLLWRIEKNLLVFKSEHNISSSKMSIMSGVSMDGNYANYVPPEERATYRGTTCCLKTIKLELKKELSRDTMKNMRAMRDIKHRNVCPFIGAYVEDRKLTLVTEYATRGSLEDILESEDIKLDNLFIGSLVQDLLRGMCFLHQSFGPHANLKSTNCVVTGRWVVQVTDYDLFDVRSEAHKALERDAEDDNEHSHRRKFLKSHLWKAPELLRQCEFARGTKESDVYAFGIILHEIVGRQGPFSTSDCNGDPNFEGIINDVRNGYNANGTLRRPGCLDLAMRPFGNEPEVVRVLKAAWAEEPKDRPDFKELTNRLKMMKKSGNLFDHMVLLLEEHNKNLEGLVRERTQEVFEEKRKTEDLLHSMLPSVVAKSLCRSIPVEPQSYDSVTIYFSDIVGFTALASASSPYEIVSFLDDLYREFDNTIHGFDVYKVETIGDAYMAVSGLPHTNEGRHAGEIASMSLELLEHTKMFKIKHRPDDTLKLRIGLHTGPVISGVVGHTMPRYCLFGDTVNTASRMESNGQPLRIHISEQCKDALTKLGGYEIEERGYVEMKGKGSVLTYWLNGATEDAIQRVEKPAPLRTFFQRLNDDGGQKDLRRRSPRLSFDQRSSRTPRDSDGPYSESPPRGLAHLHRQRLNYNHRSGSLESPSRGGLISPPCQTPSLRRHSPNRAGLWESHSLDRLPIPSPTSPLTPNSYDDTPKVNFSPLARFKGDNGEENELDPMLDDNYLGGENPSSGWFEGEGGGSRTENPDDEPRRSSIVKTFLQSILPKGKRERFNSEKSSINGLQPESHV